MKGGLSDDYTTDDKSQRKPFLLGEVLRCLAVRTNPFLPFEDLLVDGAIKNSFRSMRSCSRRFEGSRGEVLGVPDRFKHWSEYQTLDGLGIKDYNEKDMEDECVEASQRQ